MAQNQRVCKAVCAILCNYGVGVILLLFQKLVFLKHFLVVMLWVGNDVGAEWLQEVKGAQMQISDNSGILAVNSVPKGRDYFIVIDP